LLRKAIEKERSLGSEGNGLRLTEKTKKKREKVGRVRRKGDGELCMMTLNKKNGKRARTLWDNRKLREKKKKNSTWGERGVITKSTKGSLLTKTMCRFGSKEKKETKCHKKLGKGSSIPLKKLFLSGAGAASDR